jgi:hypothetical protein
LGIGAALWKDQRSLPIVSRNRNGKGLPCCTKTFRVGSKRRKKGTRKRTFLSVDPTGRRILLLLAEKEEK